MNSMKLLMWLLALLSMSPSQPHASSIAGYSVTSIKCINESLSVWQNPHPATSLLDCFVSSRSFRDFHSVGVVQRNSRDASCALFRFGQVCQLLSLINRTASKPDGDCEMIVDSEYDAITANDKFRAVWVGDRGPALENLVCDSQGQRNLMRSSNVTWTGEGAVMDGVTSRLWTDEAAGLDFTRSFTFAVHMRRVPSECYFFELTHCGSATMLDHFGEYGGPRSLYLNPGYNARFQTGSVLPSDPKQFFVAAASFDRPANRTRFFLGSSFISDEATQMLSFTNAFNEAGACLKIGWRSYSGGGRVNGAIRAAAVSNSALSEGEIRRLFQNMLT